MFFALTSSNLMINQWSQYDWFEPMDEARTFCYLSGYQTQRMGRFLGTVDRNHAGAP